MLLVDADEPETRERGEDRRARPDHDRRGAGRDALPLVAPLGLGQRRVQHGDAVAEACSEAADRLRRERDLGDEDDHASPLPQRGLRRLEVDLGLAAAGRAVEQETTALAFESLGQPGQRLELRLRQLSGPGLAAQRVAVGRLRQLLPALPLLRSDEPERAPGGRAVVVGEPECELYERRRQLLDDALDGRRLDPGRRGLVDPDDHSACFRAREPNRDDGPTLDVVRRLIREGARERTRRN